MWEIQTLLREKHQAALRRVSGGPQVHFWKWMFLREEESSPPFHGKNWSIRVVIFRWVNTILSHGCSGALRGAHFTDRAAGGYNTPDKHNCLWAFHESYVWSNAFSSNVCNYSSMQDCRFRSGNDREMSFYMLLINETEWDTYMVPLV